MDRPDLSEMNRRRVWTEKSKNKLRLARLGKKMPLEVKIKISKSLKGTRLDENNPAWKGNLVGIRALHDWVKYRLPKSKLCQNCKIRPSQDLANISQEYKRDLTDWEWLCRKCHMTKDGRLRNLTFNHPRMEEAWI